MGQYNTSKIIEETNKKKLFVASEEGNLYNLHGIIDKIDINVKGSNGETALHKAIKAGHANVVDILIENKIDVNLSDEQGITAVHLALMKGRLDIVSKLCAAGVHFSDEDNELLRANLSILRSPGSFGATGIIGY